MTGCGAWRGAGREEDGARGISGAPGARGGARSARAGRRAAGQSARSRVSPRPALRRAGRTRGRPSSPRAGDEGQHLGLGRASPLGGSGERRMCACTGKRGYFVCRLPGYGGAFIFLSLKIFAVV